jgi:hypothetical protein
MKTLETANVLKTTEKALLISVNENKSVWIPKSKFADAEKLSITEENYNTYALKEEEEVKFIEVFEKLEDYNEKSFKTGLRISCSNTDIGTRERFFFIPKSQVVVENEDSFVIPQWLFDTGVKNIIDNDIEYYAGQDEKFKSLATRDFTVESENKIFVE